MTEIVHMLTLCPNLNLPFILRLISSLIFIILVSAKVSATEPEYQDWNIHGQTTFVNQWYQSFNGGVIPDGTNSVLRQSHGAETADFTLFLGAKLGEGTEFYLNPEIDQGFGIANTLGLGGYSSGEAYKVGANAPYYRMPRAFIRQIINLGGETFFLESQPNQLARTLSSNNLIITFGKFSVVDIFDTNTYAHDSHADFLNWASLDAGAFDYAADSWGYTDGLAVEWTRDEWTWRNGLFDLSTYPNSENIDLGFKQYQLVTEFEARHTFRNHPGKFKILAFAHRGKMATYADAIAQAKGATPEVSAAGIRKLNWKTGLAINFEQELHSMIALFGRASLNDGTKETFEFADINESITVGLFLKGGLWGRTQDAIGMQLIVNGLSSSAKQYFAAGGLGLLIGDGYLNAGLEKIAEFYYSLKLTDQLSLAFNLQKVNNPAYNTSRGPLTLYAMRLHASF